MKSHSHCRGRPGGHKHQARMLGGAARGWTRRNECSFYSAQRPDSMEQPAFGQVRVANELMRGADGLPPPACAACECVAIAIAAYVRVGSNSVIAAMSAARPRFRQKRKSIGGLAMSRKCQVLTSGRLLVEKDRDGEFSGRGRKLLPSRTAAS